MFFNDLKTNLFGCVQNTAMRRHAAEGRAEGDHRRNIVRTLRSDCASDDASEAMANEMDLAAGILEGAFDSPCQSLLDQEVGAVGIDDARRRSGITDSVEPPMHWPQVSVATKKSRDQHCGGSIPARNTETVINGRGREQEQFGGKKSFGPQ